MNRYIQIILLFTTINSINIIGSEVKTIKKPPEMVSMVELLANSEKYDGKPIRVIGFTLVSPVTALIYPSHVDYEHHIRPNAIVLVLDRVAKRPGYIMKKNDKVQRQYSIIEGTFKADRRYRNLTYGGKIENITSFEVWDSSFDSGIEKK